MWHLGLGGSDFSDSVRVQGRIEVSGGVAGGRVTSALAITHTKAVHLVECTTFGDARTRMATFWGASSDFDVVSGGTTYNTSLL